MAIKVIHPTQSTPYSKAFIKTGTSYQSYSWGLSGVAPLNASGVNAKYDKDRPPFSLGSGVYVDTTGRYLMSPAYEPVSQFLVVNNGPGTIYAGINTTPSGSWGTASGLAIASGASFEFGEPGSQIIRNVWAMSDSGSNVVQGYATNQLTIG